MQTTLKFCSLLLLTGLSLFFSSCKDDSSDQIVRFTALRNGQVWEIDPTSVSAKFKNGQIEIVTGLCGVQLLFDRQQLGGYGTGREQFSFAVAHDQTCGHLFYSNLEDFITGSLELTGIDRDKKTISGKFSFSAKSSSGAPLTITDGVFDHIPFTEEAGNPFNKPLRVWVEEDGKKYAMNSSSYSGYRLYATTGSQNKILDIFFPPTSYVPGTYDVTPIGTAGANPHLAYTLIQGANSLDLSTYEPAPGSQMNITVPAGSATSFLGNFDIMLLKQGGSGPDTLRVKSEFEVYE